jgi:hypothetical protein
VAQAIAAQAGAPVTPEPFRPVIRGMLLTDDEPMYLTATIASGQGFSSEVTDAPRGRRRARSRRSSSRLIVDDRHLASTGHAPPRLANRPAMIERSRHQCAVLALVAACLAAGGCGEASPGKPTARRATVTATKTTSAPTPAVAHQRAVVAKIDASSDRILAEGKVHIAAGAPSDAEIRKEIQAARKAGIVLPSGNSASSFESAEGQASGPAANAQTPEAPWNPRAKPIADWIVPVLQWAYSHGWKGTVTSGYRTFYEQAQLNAAGAFSAPAGLSNHETTKYPGGAVDVTEPSQLIAVLRAYTGPLKLVGGVLGAVDPEHFSATGD